MKDPKEKREIERSEALDKTAKIISNLIPGGGTVYETYRTLITPLHEKKAKEWQNSVIKRLSVLEKKGKVNLKVLQHNEEFNALITKATLLALQNFQKEKINALQNLIINNAVKQTVIDYDLENYFLQIIDQLSPIHMLLLKYFTLPTLHTDDGFFFIDEKSEDVGTIFNFYPELKSKRTFIESAWNSLKNLELVSHHNIKEAEYDRKKGPIFKSTIEKEGIILISDLGKKFLESIKEEEL